MQFGLGGFSGMVPGLRVVVGPRGYNQAIARALKAGILSLF
jgi:hypothetical protein